MLIDSDILIDSSRKNPKAIEFLDRVVRTGQARISVVSYMELIVGCRNKREISDLKKFIRHFLRIDLNPAISDKAVELLMRYRASHGLLIPDALIAATAMIESDLLATKNRRDFVFIDTLELAEY